MDIFNVLTMIGGLCLFLFGMNVMGESLERAAGNSLRTLLSKLTGSRIAGFLTGLAVAAVPSALLWVPTWVPRSLPGFCPWAAFPVTV